jgi:hypothetical protein
MKKYDYAEAKKLIELNRADIAEASLGMAEDWSWTAATVFEGDAFTLDLDKEPAIAGITGSSWGTPTLSLTFKDGHRDNIPCFTGEGKEPTPEQLIFAQMTGGLDRVPEGDQ